jgi:hypothetical protein
MKGWCGIIAALLALSVETVGIYSGPSAVLRVYLTEGTVVPVGGPDLDLATKQAACAFLLEHPDFDVTLPVPYEVYQWVPVLGGGGYEPEERAKGTLEECPSPGSRLPS